jgi:hypothetical protein
MRFRMALPTIDGPIRTSRRRRRKRLARLTKAFYDSGTL